MSKLNDYLSNFGVLKENISIKTLTSFRIGGIAKYVFYPNSLENLKESIIYLKNNNIKYKIWGMGSNILASDDEYDGVIVKLDETLKEIEINDTNVVVGAGFSLIALAYKTCQLGLSGFEYATGIPGSVGGALYMNAGAYKHDTYEILNRIYVLKDNDFVWMSKDDIQYSYRHTSFCEHKDWIILKAEFTLNKEDASAIEKIVNDRKQRRMQTQPLNMPSAGSVFRNPDGYFAWQVIDEIGLRGKQIGGAMFSLVHSNFILNIDNAKATDVYELIQYAISLSKEKININLIPEVELFNWRSYD